MITFCLLVYIAIMFYMIFKCLFTREGLDGMVTQFFGTAIFLILFAIGVLAFFKLYNLHITVGT